MSITSKSGDKNPANLARRQFLERATSLGASSVIPLRLQLAAAAALGAASSTAAHAASNSGDGYKALVCVYLSGGNDHLNTLTPYDTTNYNRLATIYRPSMVEARAKLNPLYLANGTSLLSQGGLNAALHPNLSRIAKIFNSNRKLAILNGVGTMTQPFTKADYNLGILNLPPGAASHNDGNSMFHTLGTEGARYGWGGRMLDTLSAFNGNSLFPSLGVGYYNAFGSGERTQQFTTDENADARNVEFVGKTSMFGSSTGPAELEAITREKSSNYLEDAHSDIYRRLLNGTTQIASAYAATTSVLDGVFSRQTDMNDKSPDAKDWWQYNSLGKQLRSVARLIKARQNLGGVKRQVFFCDLRGFDTHDALLTQHGALMSYLDRALSAFHEEMERQGVSDQVTLFTTSEFGRPLYSNGNGTDHGWGGTSFIMGGAVNGGQIYGDLAEMDVASNDYLANNNSILIPKISVEQYGATLAKWMGVNDTDLNVLFPYLSRFSKRDLGFLS
jgi:uncharacterized protein (DUF1501 family)